MSYPSYPEYRDSGLDWPSQTPSHWRTAKFKHLARINNGRDYKEVEEDDGPYPVIGSGGEFARASDYLYEGESVLLGRKGTVDKPLYVNGAFWTVDTMFYTHLERHTSGRFLYYLATTICFDRYSTNTALPSMAQEDLANIQIVAPDFWEQTQIARFLDHQTARIDALIAEQQRLIQLLKEKRQAVISHAVTKGLDPNVAMKDSGVEWLGEVPAHWQIIPFKYTAKLNPPKSGYSGSRSINCSFVPMDKLKTDQLGLDESRLISDVFDGYTYFREGDVLVAKVTPCFENRNIAIANNLANGVGFGTSEIFVFRPEKMCSRYLFYRLLEDVLVNYWTAEMTGAGGLKRVPASVVENYLVALPTKGEQEAISSYLDMKTQQFESLITEARSAVGLLKERRSALISAAVTGKIDVRDWQPPNSETFPESTEIVGVPA